QMTIAGEIRDHLLGGGELRERGLLFRRTIRKRWQSAYEAWRVNGRPPESAEEVSAIRQLLAVEISRAHLGRLWDGLMAANQAQPFAELHDEPERAAGQF